MNVDMAVTKHGIINSREREREREIVIAFGARSCFSSECLFIFYWDSIETYTCYIMAYVKYEKMYDPEVYNVAIQRKIFFLLTIY